MTKQTTNQTSGTPRLCASLIVAVVCGVQNGALFGADKPNILFIHMEDMGVQIPAYGDTTVATPNLDRLAAEGIVFERAHVTAATCAASRGTLFSGLYPHQNGIMAFVQQHGFHYREGIPTFVRDLKRAGYATGITYKDGVDSARYTTRPVPFDFHPKYTENWLTGLTGKNAPKSKDLPALASFSVDNFKYFLENLNDSQPFYFQAQTPDTHHVWDRSHFIRQGDPGWPYPEVDLRRVTTVPGWGDSFKPRGALKEIIAEYYGAIQRVDWYVGQILTLLGEYGHADDTLVIFSADHGPSHLLRGKATAGENGLRVPFIVRWPGHVKEPGSRSDALVSFVDLYPTFVDAAGLDIPEHLPGYSILPVLKGNPSPRRHLYSAFVAHTTGLHQYWPTRSVTDGRWKLTHHVFGDGKRARYPDGNKAVFSLNKQLEELPANSLARRLAKRCEVPPAFELYDLRPVMGCYGGAAKTPHLDKLARNATVFTRHYNQWPVCGPSRASMLGGLRPDTTGIYENGESWKISKRPATHPTIPKHFRDNGYKTLSFGKVYHGKGVGKGYGWSEEPWKLDWTCYVDFEYAAGNKRQWRPAYEIYDGPDSRHNDFQTAEKVIQALEVNKDRPFFIAAGFYKPHLPFVASKRYWDLYSVDEIGVVEPTGLSQGAADFMYNWSEILEKAEGDVNRANVEEVDTSVGRVLDTLRELELDKKTLVLFTSDNGGAGGMSMGPLRGGKGGPKYEGHMREPTLAWWPGTIPPGVESDAIVTTTDILPSLAKLVGAKAPDDRTIDGKDALDVLLGQSGAKSPHEILYYETDGVRRGKWKLVRIGRPGKRQSELYDLEADLGETNNLANQHPELVEELGALLDEHAERIAADTRPAAFVEDARPILSEPGDLPRLRELMGIPNATVGIPPVQPTPEPSAPRHRPNRIHVTPAVYTPAADDILIADFESQGYGDWEVIGEAMGDRPSQAETHKNRATGFLGKGFVNTYLDGDTTTGELTSPPFRIERKYINFLIGGGNHPGRAGIQLRVDDETVRYATGRSLKNTKNQEIMDWQSLDVSEFIGKQAILKIVDSHSGGWGHTVVDHIFQSDKPMPSSLPKRGIGFQPVRPKPTTGRMPIPQSTDPALLKPGQFDPVHRTFALYGDVGYDQKLRPQFHFSSRKNWINDPNGMVYYDGEWHLYFQHCALSVNRGPKSWGHAVSKDMVHWEQLPHAILPYDKGAIWSGTAVVDHNNSLGKQVGDTKTLVAFFTTTWKDGFYQAMAYSIDRGRTYTLYNNGEPVVPNQGVMKGERDPKVFWDAARQKWKMILIVGGKERLIRIFESDNLTDWVKAGDINRQWAAECIDLFQLPVDGDRNNMKWVITDASFDYEIGQFTGHGFETEGETRRGDYGKGFYAAQTFNNGPDGRVVQIGWMNDRHQECPFLVEGMPFNQQMAFPTDLTLRTTPDGIRLFRWPVPEIKSLYQKSHTFGDLTVESANKALSVLKPELVDLSIEFTPGDDAVVDLTIRSVKITYGNLMKLRTATGVREVKCFHFNGKSCPAPIIDGRVKLRVLADRASLELYANEGATVASSYEFEIPEDYTLSISSNREVLIHSLVVNQLESIWGGALKGTEN